MRNIKHIVTVAVLFMALGTSESFAQFEQKVTLNFSVGSIKPIGVREYIYESTNGDYLNTWLMPYLFSNYKMGYSFTGGAQFNINRFFSLGTGIGVERIGSWQYTDSYSINGQRYEKEFLAWEITQDESVLDEGINELKMYNFSIGVFPRINMAYGKRLNPYVYVEVTFNYTDINYVDNRREAWIDLGGSEQSYDEWFESLSSPSAYNKTPKSSFGIGLYPGVGFDLNLNSNVGVFVQGGYSFISINKADLEESNLEPENFNTIKVEVGFKFSFLRSKDI